MTNIRSMRIEIGFTAVMLLAMALLSLCYGLKIGVPKGMAAMVFAGQAALPLSAIALWAGWAALTGRRVDPVRPVLAVACYALVLIVHFNMKLWVPFVRPTTYDLLLWRIDQFAYPLVRLCKAISVALTPVINPDGGFYVASLPVMLYFSLAYHGCRTPEVLGKLFLSVLFLQGLGGLSYYALPSVGPFLFEQGTNSDITHSEQGMLAAQHAAIAMGPKWLIQYADSKLFAGLGAMPSLHAAWSYLFVRFAWRHGRVLLPAYLPLFGYILVTAIASRWHYLADLPVGIALAHGSIRLADALDDRTAPSRPAEAVPAATGGAAGGSTQGLRGWTAYRQWERMLRPDTGLVRPLLPRPLLRRRRPTARDERITMHAPSE